LGEAAELGSGSAFAGFDLEADHGAVVVFDHEVNLGAVAGAPVPQRDGLVQPGRLFAYLADDEGLQQVPEVGQC
jgi:hypothetical protein